MHKPQYNLLSTKLYDINNKRYYCDICNYRIISCNNQKMNIHKLSCNKNNNIK